MQRNATNTQKGAAALFTCLLIIGIYAYTQAYPCREYRTIHEIDHTCFFIGKTLQCTTRPDEHLICARR